MRREYYDTHKKRFSRGAVDGVSSSKEGGGGGGGGEKGKKKGHSHPLIPLRAFRNTAYEAANSLGKC